MGGVTALLEVYRDPTISGIVVDSSFSSLTTLAHEIAYRSVQLPSFLISTAMSIVRKSIFKRAHFDINEIAPLNLAGSSYVPAVFAYAVHDAFVSPKHTVSLHSVYAGDKMLVSFEGDHNTRRPDSFNYSAAGFFYTALGVAELPLVFIPKALPRAS
jgi:hypothetical protein